MREHFAPLFKVQDEVEIGIVFKVEPELDQKREIDRVEDSLFGQRVVHLGKTGFSTVNTGHLIHPLRRHL